MNEIETQARICKVFSVPTRIEMIALLRNKTLCVNALSQKLGITPAAVSQHLRVLRDADVVIAEKRGYFVHYRVNAKTLAAWGQTISPLFKAPSCSLTVEE